MTAYNLGVRKDTTVRMRHRWKSETSLRLLPEEPARLVFSFGVADVANRVSAEESLGAAVAMLMQARQVGDVLVIGPTPVNDADKRAEIASLSRQFEAMCRRLEIPFVPAFDAMHHSFVYGEALNKGDGVHPAASGYADLADHILKSDTARTFFGIA